MAVNYTGKCHDGEPHKWQPVSVVIENGIQPPIEGAKVYVICMKCGHWSYTLADYIGYAIDDRWIPDDQKQS